ncbi:hypothetical protein AALP_AAs61116U000100, partial [Arabis alpina]
MMQHRRGHRASRRRCRDEGCLAPMSLSSDTDDRQWRRCHCPVMPMSLASSASRHLTSSPEPFPSASGPSTPVRTSARVPEDDDDVETDDDDVEEDDDDVEEDEDDVEEDEDDVEEDE